MSVEVDEEDIRQASLATSACMLEKYRRKSDDYDFQIPFAYGILNEKMVCVFFYFVLCNVVCSF